MSLALLLHLAPETNRRSYATDVVDELVILKREGWTWERSWSIATAKHLPPPFWRRRAGEDESPLNFLERHCYAAWHGEVAEKPEQAGLVAA